MKASYPNLRNLTRMLRVIDVGRLTAVAETVGRSQQTITHSIQALEQELGVQLFERTSLGTRATRQAVMLGQRVRNALGHLAEAQAVFNRQNRMLGRQSLRICELNVNNQQVLIFLGICEQQEARRVAAQLGLDVSAVRKALRSLEGQVGQPLFEKASRGFLIPSEFAELLAKQMKLALWEIRAGVDELRSADGTIQGEVVFGASPHAHPTLVPRIIGRLRAKHPRLKLTLRIDSYDDLEKALSCREADFIVGSERGTPYSPDLVARPLLEDRVEILARKGHPLAETPTDDISRYLACQWVLPPRHVPMRRRFIDFLRNQELAEPVAVFESGDYAIVRGLVTETDSVALVLRCEALHDVEHGDLCFLPRPAGFGAVLDVPVPLHLTFPVAASRAPSAQAFYDEAMRVAAELQEHVRPPGEGRSRVPPPAPSQSPLMSPPSQLASSASPLPASPSPLVRRVK